MRYPIAIEPGDQQNAYGVVVPDLPGCFSAGDTLDAAIVNAKEAIELWLETTVADGGSIPSAGAIESYRDDPAFADWIWAVVEVDSSKLSGKIKRVNITLPERVLAAIDQAASRHGETRSGLLAKAALEYVERHPA